MLIFAAITPHPPILISSIGRENLSLIKQTQEAMRKLEEELYAAKPGVLIIISPHGQILAEAFSLSVSPSYEGNFEQFGDFVTYLKFKGEPSLAHQIKESLETKIPLVLLGQRQLDHGTLVPLFYLSLHLPKIRLVPLGYSLLNLETHFKFGQLLKEEILKTNKRIAVIASGDLSHRLTPDAPAGFSPQGKVFDEKLARSLKEKDIRGILNLDSKLIEEAGECGLRSIIILLGILDKINWEPDILSYEGPFGVGYLAANFKLI